MHFRTNHNWPDRSSYRRRRCRTMSCHPNSSSRRHPSNKTVHQGRHCRSFRSSRCHWMYLRTNHCKAFGHKSPNTSHSNRLVPPDKRCHRPRNCCYRPAYRRTWCRISSFRQDKRASTFHSNKPAPTDTQGCTRHNSPDRSSCLHKHCRTWSFRRNTKASRFHSNKRDPWHKHSRTCRSLLDRWSY